MQPTVGVDSRPRKSDASTSGSSVLVDHIKRALVSLEGFVRVSAHFWRWRLIVDGSSRWSRLEGLGVGRIQQDALRQVVNISEAVSHPPNLRAIVKSCVLDNAADALHSLLAMATLVKSFALTASMQLDDCDHHFPLQRHSGGCS